MGEVALVPELFDVASFAFGPFCELVLDFWAFAAKKLFDCLSSFFVFARSLEGLESSEVPATRVFEGGNG